jgi:3-deoxy-D-manno-octulosonate 8-phosphate phosphatase (KDO 8-P phosphatase)
LLSRAVITATSTPLSLSILIPCPSSELKRFDTVKQYANLITEKSGGHGAVREVCDFILKAQGKFDDAMKLYLD